MTSCHNSNRISGHMVCLVGPPHFVIHRLEDELLWKKPDCTTLKAKQQKHSSAWSLCACVCVCVCLVPALSYLTGQADLDVLMGSVRSGIYANQAADTMYASSIIAFRGMGSLKHSELRKHGCARSVSAS